jgi:hypothetical protein
MMTPAARFSGRRHWRQRSCTSSTPTTTIRHAQPAPVRCRYTTA